MMSTQVLAGMQTTASSPRLDSCRRFGRRFWFTHAIIPFAALLCAFLICTTLGLDRMIAHRLHDARGDWPAHGVWWANAVLHTGGQWAMRILGAAALLGWIASYRSTTFERFRRPLAFFTLALALNNAVVGLLKRLTNVDCPWDLQEFGGLYPYVALFADRADDLRHAACFPAAHAGAGYALLAAYFVWRDADPGKARLGLATGLGVGLIFGLTQQLRGAHFLSHDIASLAIVWAGSLALYALAFGGQLWPRYAGGRQPLPAHCGPAADGVRSEIRKPPPGTRAPASPAP
jgi:membrane-associated PAP2 superfamily phosphatase